MCAHWLFEDELGWCVCVQVTVMILHDVFSLTLDIPRLPTVERKELFNAIFDIAAYWPPANIHLPEEYEAPKLAISKLYWKGWILLLVLAAFNPKTIGTFVP